MATGAATLGKPVEDAMLDTRHVASRQRYSLAEGEGGPNMLVLRKGVTPLSWGSELVVTFEPVSPTQTRLAVSTGETWGFTDWGRGKRAIRKLLDALGATYEAE